MRDAKTEAAALLKTIRANGLTVMNEGAADMEPLTVLSKAQILAIDVAPKKIVSIGEAVLSAEIKSIS